MNKNKHLQDGKIDNKKFNSGAILVNASVLHLKMKKAKVKDRTQHLRLS